MSQMQSGSSTQSPKLGLWSPSVLLSLFQVTGTGIRALFGLFLIYFLLLTYLDAVWTALWSLVYVAWVHKPLMALWGRVHRIRRMMASNAKKGGSGNRVSVSDLMKAQ